MAGDDPRDNVHSVCGWVRVKETFVNKKTKNKENKKHSTRLDSIQLDTTFFEPDLPESYHELSCRMNMYFASVPVS